MKLYQRGATSGFGRRPLLGEVVPDHRELIRELVPQEDHRNDYGYRDDRNDECVFDQALP
jgi:hypothetical protein